MREDRKTGVAGTQTALRTRTRDYLILLLMVLTQISLFYSLTTLTDIRRTLVSSLSFGIAQICFLLVDIYAVVWILNQRKRQRDETELSKIRYEMEQERIQYQELKKEQEYMARLRHDYNNQLNTIQYLMKHEPEAAGEMTRSLLERIEEEERKTKDCGGDPHDHSHL